MDDAAATNAATKRSLAAQGTSTVWGGMQLTTKRRATCGQRKLATERANHLLSEVSLKTRAIRESPSTTENLRSATPRCGTCSLLPPILLTRPTDDATFEGQMVRAT